MSGIIKPNFGNVSQQTWDRFYRYACDQQNADKYFTRERLLATKAAHKWIHEHITGNCRMMKTSGKTLPML